ncbi:hypothetical protein BDZ97DRAFT_1336511 [Flammula alnicola]|nr:hypothetical protein BDZ97DRAFT_1336511 [Flammula alnicola]
MDLDVFDAVNAKLTFLVRGCAYAALFLTLWEWATTLNFETLIIWRKGTDYRIRWLYCTSRYIGVLAQMINAFVVAFIQFNRFESHRHCQIWYGFQLITCSVTWPLLAGVVIETVIFTACGCSAIQDLTFAIDGGCLPMHAPPTVMYLTVIQILTQLVIWVLTVYKSYMLYSFSGWKKIPILSLVTRDGFWVFAVFTALLSAILVDASNRQPGDRTAQLCYIIFPIYVAVVSLSSCRITMNLRTFTSDLPTRSSFDTEHVELTTLFTTINSIS